MIHHFKHNFSPFFNTPYSSPFSTAIFPPSPCDSGQRWGLPASSRASSWPPCRCARTPWRARRSGEQRNVNVELMVDVAILEDFKDPKCSSFCNHLAIGDGPMSYSRMVIFVNCLHASVSVYICMMVDVLHYKYLHVNPRPLLSMCTCVTKSVTTWWATPFFGVTPEFRAFPSLMRLDGKAQAAGPTRPRTEKKHARDGQLNACAKQLSLINPKLLSVDPSLFTINQLIRSSKPPKSRATWSCSVGAFGHSVAAPWIATRWRSWCANGVPGFNGKA